MGDALARTCSAATSTSSAVNAANGAHTTEKSGGATGLGDDPEVASYLRIEERKLEGVG